MFGLIMALTFTCTISVTSSTRADVMTMLAGALGCNIAWGIVDAAMFLLAQIVSREQRRSLAQDIAVASPPQARQLLIDHLPDGMVLLFVVGTGLGKHMKWEPYWVTGLSVALFGALLVAITIALGG